MLDFNTIFLFIFIFSCHIILKNILKMIGILLGKNTIFTGRDLLFLYLTSSYFLTYLIKFVFNIYFFCYPCRGFERIHGNRSCYRCIFQFFAFDLLPGITAAALPLGYQFKKAVHCCFLLLHFEL